MSSRSFLGFSLGHGVSFALAFNFFLRWGFWLFFFFFLFFFLSTCVRRDFLLFFKNCLSNQRVQKVFRCDSFQLTRVFGRATEL